MKDQCVLCVFPRIWPACLLGEFLSACTCGSWCSWVCLKSPFKNTSLNCYYLKLLSSFLDPGSRQGHRIWGKCCVFILECLKAADVFRAINSDSEPVIWCPVMLGWQTIPLPALIILLDTSPVTSYPKECLILFNANIVLSITEAVESTTSVWNGVVSATLTFHWNWGGEIVLTLMLQKSF